MTSNHPFRVAPLLITAFSLLSPRAHSLTPEQVFDIASPSVVVTKVRGQNGKSLGLGSGVIVGAGLVITNCHVTNMKDGVSIQVIRGRKSYDTETAFEIKESDLCLLTAKGLNAAPLRIKSISELRPGQRVYAIGSPSGLELTISEGLISGIRESPSRETLIQTSAQISPGSSGGGLFSEEGELVGITSFSLKSGNGLNFARAAEYISAIMYLRGVARGGYRSTVGRTTGFETEQSATAWLALMSAKIGDRIPDPTTRAEFLRTVAFEAIRAGLQPGIVLATIDAASGFRKYAVSSDGAKGFMQVAPDWIEKIGTPDQNLFHLRTNLRYGCTILRHFVELSAGDTEAALVAYANRNFPGGPVQSPLSGKPFADKVISSFVREWANGLPQ